MSHLIVSRMIEKKKAFTLENPGIYNDGREKEKGTKGASRCLKRSSQRGGGGGGGEPGEEKLFFT